MKEVKYTSTHANPTRDRPNDTREAEEFLASLEEDSLHIVCQPGDVTRYEIYIARLADDQILVSCPDEGHCWHIHSCATPYDFSESMYENTRCVLADICNAVLNADMERFFDWEIARPAEEVINA